MANLHHFLRSVSPNDLRQHLEQSGIPVPANLNWDASAEEFSKGFLKAVEQLSEQNLVQLLADIDRITDMTDEVGQAALMSLVDWRERLKAMDSAYHRAHWLYRRVARSVPTGGRNQVRRREPKRAAPLGRLCRPAVRGFEDRPQDYGAIQMNLDQRAHR